MNHRTNNQLLNIQIKFSLFKFLLIILPHVFIALTLCIVAYTGYMSVFVLLICLIVICISFVYFFKLYLQLSLFKSIKVLNKDRNGHWNITLKNNETKKVVLLGTSFSSNTLLIMNFSDASGKLFSVLFTQDSVSKEIYRKLKVCIKTMRMENANN